MFEEFKKFILRGNVIDMAVGVIIGTAFGAIVSSLVSDVLMPPIGGMLKNVDFKDLAIELPFSRIDPDTVDKPGVTPTKIPVKISYGKFFQKVIDFIIIALCLFLVIKGMNKLQKKKEDSPLEPTASEKLLVEIRDLLKNQTK